MGGTVVNEGTSWFYEDGELGLYWSASRTSPALHTFVKWGPVTSSTIAAHDTACAAASGSAADFRAAMPSHVQAWWDAQPSAGQALFQTGIAALWAAGARVSKV